MSLIDYFISDKKKVEIVNEYINTLKHTDTSSSEKLPWMITSEKPPVDEYDMPEIITKYTGSREDAHRIGKLLKNDYDSIVEIWTLIKRW